MSSLFFIIATVAYFVGSVGYFFYVIRNSNSVARAANIALVIGFAFHTVGIYILARKFGYLPVTSIPQTLSLFAWTIVLAYLVFQWRFDIKILGTFVSPLAMFFMLLSPAIPSGVVHQIPVLKSIWVVVHISLIFLSNALFAIAFCAGIMYLIQEKQIKKKTFGVLFRRLPSLEKLDKTNYICLLIGFPLLTGGLITGFIYASRVWHGYWHWDPKEIFAMVTWAIYAVLFHERLAVGWRGKKAAIMAIIGFIAVIVTFLGVNIFLKGHHFYFRVS